MFWDVLECSISGTALTVGVFHKWHCTHRLPVYTYVNNCFLLGWAKDLSALLCIHVADTQYLTYLNSVLNILTLMCLLMNINIKIYKIVILHSVYGCETLSGSLREEHSLGMFKNRVMRKMFGLKRE